MPLSPRTRRRYVILPFLSALMAVPVGAQAPGAPEQSGTYTQPQPPQDPSQDPYVDGGELDNPSGAVTYNEGNLFRPACWSLLSANNFPFSPDCFSNKTDAETNSREEARTNDRWVRAGVLTLTELWQGVQYVKSLLNTYSSLRGTFERIVHAFNGKKPELTLYAIRDASDAVDQRLAQAEYLNRSFRLPGGQGDHYAMINGVVQRALSQSRDAGVASTTLSDQVNSARAALAGGESINIFQIGGSAMSSTADPPPLPYALEMDGETFTDDEAGDSGAPSAAPHTQPLAAARPATAARVMRAATSGVPRPSVEETQYAPAGPTCQVDIDNQDAQGLIAAQRAIVAAQGAQAAAAITGTDITDSKSTVQTIAEREKTHEEESRISTIIRMIQMM